MRCPAFDNKSCRQGCIDFCCYFWNRESWKAHCQDQRNQRDPLHRVVLDIISRLPPEAFKWNRQ